MGNGCFHHFHLLWGQLSQPVVKRHDPKFTPQVSEVPERRKQSIHELGCCSISNDDLVGISYKFTLYGPSICRDSTFEIFKVLFTKIYRAIDVTNGQAMKKLRDGRN